MNCHKFMFYSELNLIYSILRLCEKFNALNVWNSVEISISKKIKSKVWLNFNYITLNVSV